MVTRRPRLMGELVVDDISSGALFTGEDVRSQPTLVSLAAKVYVCHTRTHGGALSAQLTVIDWLIDSFTITNLDML